MASDVHISPYFERIGFAGSIAPNLATLESLHALHPAAIAFEGLNPLLGLPVLLDQKSLAQKLVADKRGGYCFEHNLLFMRVLRELEYPVRGHLARVLWNHPEGTIRRRSHMVLTVDIGGATYLADVGFGGLTLTAPLRLKADIEQPTPHEVFRLLSSDGLWRLETRIGEDWKPLYSFDLTEQQELDFDHPNYYVSTHPESPFRTDLIVARPSPGRRYTLRDNRLSTHVVDGASEHQLLDSVEAIKEALTGVFGIALPPADLLDPALERILAKSGDAA